MCDTPEEATAAKRLTSHSYMSCDNSSCYNQKHHTVLETCSSCMGAGQHRPATHTNQDTAASCVLGCAHAAAALQPSRHSTQYIHSTHDAVHANLEALKLSNSQCLLQLRVVGTTLIVQEDATRQLVVP